MGNLDIETPCAETAAVFLHADFLSACMLLDQHAAWNSLEQLRYLCSTLPQIGSGLIPVDDTSFCRAVDARARRSHPRRILARLPVRHAKHKPAAAPHSAKIFPAYSFRTHWLLCIAHLGMRRCRGSPPVLTGVCSGASRRI